MSEREVVRIIVLGMQGVGKSYETIRALLESSKGAPGIPPRKGLIFDVNDEFGDFEYSGEGNINGRMYIRAISLDSIPLFTVNRSYEVRRIRPFDKDGNPMGLNDKAAALERILNEFNNGNFLVEDPNTYVSDNIPADIIGKLVSTRHRSTDMFLHFQSVGRAGHPKIFGNTSYIRMHKTNDPVSRHKDKFQEKTELLQLAEYIVNEKYQNGNTRFFLWIDVVNSKIRSDKAHPLYKTDAEDAVHEYVSQNYNACVKPYLNKRDKGTGKLIHDDKSALQMARDEMMRKYFAFPVKPPTKEKL